MDRSPNRKKVQQLLNFYPVLEKNLQKVANFASSTRKCGFRFDPSLYPINSDHASSHPPSFSNQQPRPNPLLYFTLNQPHPYPELIISS